MTPTAHVRVLRRPPYYGDRIAASLSRMGYKIIDRPATTPRKGDVLVIWNRYPRDERSALAYDAAGGVVVVVENGYFGRDFMGEQWFAISHGQHNGAGKLPPPSPDRWIKLGIDLKPWRLDGQEIVVMATRGFGSDRVREPHGWSQKIAGEIARRTSRQVRIRDHPGPQSAVPKVSLEDDLADAYAAVTWASSAGLKAIAMGVPVFHGLPNWIGADAARHVDNHHQTRFTGDRVPMFDKVAAAMWSLSEIESGKAFQWCLR